MNPDARARAGATRATRATAIRAAATHRRRTRGLHQLATTGPAAAPLWLSTTQVARLLHVPLHRVQTACRDGRLTAVRTGAHWRVRSDRLAGVWL